MNQKWKDFWVRVGQKRLTFPVAAQNAEDSPDGDMVEGVSSLKSDGGQWIEQSAPWVDPNYVHWVTTTLGWVVFFFWKNNCFSSGRSKLYKHSSLGLRKWLRNIVFFSAAVGSKSLTGGTDAQSCVQRDGSRVNPLLISSQIQLLHNQ